MAVWICPGCQRRVPDRIGVCHCGTRREQAAPTAAADDRRVEAARPVPRRTAGSGEGLATAGAIARDAWPYVAVFVLALAGAVVWAAFWRPEVLPPLLGYMGADRPSPPPPPAAPPAKKTP